MAFVTLDNVYKRYHMGEITINAADGMTFDIQKGEFAIIVGPSGSGKTTVLNMLGGMDTCDEGVISVDGERIDRFNRRQLTNYRRYDVGFIFQFYNLMPNLTAKENVELAAQTTKDFIPAAEILKKVGLGERLQNFPAQLSGGEQQRVAVARALAHGPKLIIADEPTGNIDPEMSMDIMQLFEAINKVHITVVVVTHEHELVHKLAAKYNNRIITLANGHVASDTAHPEVAQEYEEWLAARQNDDEYEYED